MRDVDRLARHAPVPDVRRGGGAQWLTPPQATLCSPRCCEDVKRSARGSARFSMDATSEFVALRWRAGMQPAPHGSASKPRLGNGLDQSQAPSVRLCPFELAQN